MKLKIDNKWFLNKMGAKYFSPILKVKIDKYKTAELFTGVADYLRRGGKRRGAEICGEFLGPANFTKKKLSILRK